MSHQPEKCETWLTTHSYRTTVDINSHVSLSHRFGPLTGSAHLGGESHYSQQGCSHCATPIKWSHTQSIQWYITAWLNTTSVDIFLVLVLGLDLKKIKCIFFLFSFCRMHWRQHHHRASSLSLLTSSQCWGSSMGYAETATPCRTISTEDHFWWTGELRKCPCLLMYGNAKCL